MTTTSAPGKVYLFGEHAVVYGEPAIPCAIERRARVSATLREDDRVVIDAPDLSLSGYTVSFADTGPAVDVPDAIVRAGLAYVRTGVERVRDRLDRPDLGVDLAVESDLPLGAGLGSSAAVTVATIDATARATGTILDRSTVADAAYRVETTVQDGEASRADTFCSATGGAVRVEGDDCRSIAAPDLPLVIGYDGGSGDTGELVAGVRRLREEYGFAADTVRSIGALVRAGERALDRDDLDELGRLMDIDHGLLSTLGVSARTLDAMVWAARDGGALGAKLTGAGGGGCIVALAPRGGEDGVERALSLAPECVDAYRAQLAHEGLSRGGET